MTARQLEAAEPGVKAAPRQGLAFLGGPPQMFASQIKDSVESAGAKPLRANYRWLSEIVSPERERRGASLDGENKRRRWIIIPSLIGTIVKTFGVRQASRAPYGNLLMQFQSKCRQSSALRSYVSLQTCYSIIFWL
ncbi:unnamed protein product [Pleuronectes platessa]|uniref:Uncharacterized protein n=1 Tax=Pleuronectes platessa TaxID=8262 RepID=A0A9N7VSY8_PLEPL|nr:unnamed protein product [Pleuronectes platessa]